MSKKDVLKQTPERRAVEYVLFETVGFDKLNVDFDDIKTKVYAFLKPVRKHLAEKTVSYKNNAVYHARRNLERADIIRPVDPKKRYGNWEWVPHDDNRKNHAATKFNRYMDRYGVDDQLYDALQFEVLMDLKKDEKNDIKMSVPGVIPLWNKVKRHFMDVTMTALSLLPIVNWFCM